MRLDLVEAVNQVWSALLGTGATLAIDRLKDRNQRRRIVATARRAIDADPTWDARPAAVRQLLSKDWFLEVLAFPGDEAAQSRVAVPSEAELDDIFGPDVDEETRRRWVAALAEAVWAVTAKDASLSDTAQLALLRRNEETLLNLVNIGLDTHDLVDSLAHRPPTRPPAELPLAPSVFVGRDREVADLLALCRKSGDEPGRSIAVVVSGPPGVGKSALVLNVAHALKDEFPDGQLYRNLRPGSGDATVRTEEPATVLAQFLRSLGVAPDAVPDGLEGRAAAYRSELAERRVLVVLDDAMDEATVRSLLPGGGRSLALVTSRRPLLGLDGVESFPIEGLDPDASIALVAAAAGRGQPGDARDGGDRDGLAEVAALCGYLPLALRVAAGRLRGRPDWQPADLARRLREARHAVSELRVGDLDVRASIDLSYQALAPEAARLLRHLAFAPGWTFSQGLAQALTDGDDDAEVLLDSLVLDQLIAPTGVPGTFAMHPLVRSFAGEQVPPADQTALLDRILVWYADRIIDAVYRLSGTAPPEPHGREGDEEALAWLLSEAPTLGHVIELCDHLGLDEFTVAFADPVAFLYRQLGFIREQGEILATGLAAARRTGATGSELPLLNALGIHAASSGDWSTAARHWTDALAAVDAESHPRFASGLHDNLSIAYQRLGQPDDARAEMALARACIADADPALARFVEARFTLDALLELLESGATPDQAAIDTAIADLAETLDDADVSIMYKLEARIDLATAHAWRGRHGETTRQLERCRTICSDYGVKAYTPRVLLLLGEAYQRRGMQARAREAWQEGFDLSDALGLTDRMGGLAYNLAKDHARHGDLATAAKLLDRAAAAFDELGQRFNRSGALWALAYVKHSAGDRAGAEAAWDEAAATLDAAGDSARADATRAELRTARAADDRTLRERAARWARRPPQIVR